MHLADNLGPGNETIVLTDTEPVAEPIDSAETKPVARPAVAIAIAATVAVDLAELLGFNYADAADLLADDLPPPNPETLADPHGDTVDIADIINTHVWVCDGSVLHDNTPTSTHSAADRDDTVLLDGSRCDPARTWRRTNEPNADRIPWHAKRFQ